MRVTTHLAAALTCVCALSFGASAAQAADLAPATTPPIEVTTADLGKLSLPDDLRNYTDLGSMFQRQPLLGPDGSPLWLFNRQLSADDAKGLGVVTADLSGAPSLDFGTVRGSVALRRSDGGYNTAATSFGAGVSAVGGNSWIVDHRFTPRPARDRLVALDDRLRAVRSVRLPKRVWLAGAVSTSRGLRLIGIEHRSAGKRSTSFVVVVDGKRVTRQKFIADLESAAALPDGSVLLTGRSGAKTELPRPVLRISPSGKVSRMADRREPSAASFTGQAVATKAGVAMLESSSSGTPEADALKSAVVLRDGRGKVTQRRFIRELDFPRTGCDREPLLRLQPTLQVGPDGLPVIQVVCSELDEYSYISSQGTQVYTQRVDRTVTMLGLSADLRVRWWRNANRSGAMPANVYLCGSESVDRAGRLLIIGCGGSVQAATIPGALPVTRGAIKSSRRDGKLGAVVRVTCRGDHGSVCSGVARVLVNGTTVGSVPYALPGRPGKAAAILDRHVPTSRPLPKRFTVQLGT